MRVAVSVQDVLHQTVYFRNTWVSQNGLQHRLDEMPVPSGLFKRV